MEILTPSDYQARARKRPRRSGRPCEACRKRKTRCVVNNGEQECVYCGLRGSQCIFKTRSCANISDDTHPPPAVQHPVSAFTSPVLPAPPAEPSLDPTRIFNDKQSPVEVRTTAVNTQTAVVSDAVTANLTLGLSQNRFAELYGLGSDMEPILMRHRPYDPLSQEFGLETHAIRRVRERDFGHLDYPLTFHMVSDEKALEFDATYSQADAIEALVRPHGPSLVGLFWMHVQPSYPILHKGFFMQNYSQSYRQIPAPLLGAVYLSAIRWWTYDSQLSIRPLPDSTSLRKTLLPAIHSSYHQPKLSSIQAILLLLQCQPEDPLNPDHTYAWGLMCQALAIGQCLGLHLDASDWSIPVWERNIRKRLSWALFIQDRWAALAFGRPVHINLEDWAVRDLSDMDFSDCDDSSSDEQSQFFTTTAKSQFILMVQLTHVLSSVLSSFYTARTCRDQDTVLLYQRARPLLDQLQDWYQSIPSSLQMNIAYHRQLSYHGCLHFSYYGVVISLLRRLIRSTALPPRCSDDQVLSEIRDLALRTAQNAFNFVLNLRPDQLEAFWYFTSPYLFSLLGSFITLLLVTSLSSQERGFWQEMLNSYLWNLRMRSQSCEPMRYAVNRLECAILRGLEHALAVNLNEPLDNTIGSLMANPSTQSLGYADFGDWDIAAGIDGVFDLLSAAGLDPNALMPTDAVANELEYGPTGT